ncbi:hypothetical protein F8388_003679 [Cannabis sativa]|uniref:FYVE-type domain-containing protein n=1 Tax=Cannabis sativa TaxID=3483 RepID=A0A7J6F6V9_CANSA|nr:hypothetical protein F8388_003679 [Cannabis sativa]
MEPPTFQEAARCDVCKCSFNTFRRRHHCRCCGRTLCNEHSSNQMALPQFGIQSAVRVCADCFNKPGQSSVRVSPNEANSITDAVSSLSIADDTQSKTEPTVEHQPAVGIIECKCGMPLCICEAPAPSVDVLPLPKKPSPTSIPRANPKPKKTETASKNKGSTSYSKPSSVFNPGQVYNGMSDKSQMDYDVNGEGMREAIKNGDTAAVKKLLSQGVDANYHDKQGFSLMDSGANLNYKNAQGETPLDCAPATLQYKMREKIKELEQLGQQ